MENLVEEIQKKLKVEILRERYRTLSALEEEFPRNSKHKAFKVIQKRMADTISEIEKK